MIGLEQSRTCIGCRNVAAKADMVRICSAAGKVSLDRSGTGGGRGAYLCHSADCLKIALKRGALERALKVKIANEELSAIGRELELMLTARGDRNA